jgi:hypothetical protein
LDNTIASLIQVDISQLENAYGRCSSNRRANIDVTVVSAHAFTYTERDCFVRRIMQSDQKTDQIFSPQHVRLKSGDVLPIFAPSHPPDGARIISFSASSSRR